MCKCARKDSGQAAIPNCLFIFDGRRATNSGERPASLQVFWNLADLLLLVGLAMLPLLPLLSAPMVLPVSLQAVLYPSARTLGICFRAFCRLRAHSVHGACAMSVIRGVLSDALRSHRSWPCGGSPAGTARAGGVHGRCGTNSCLACMRLSALSPTLA